MKEAEPEASPSAGWRRVYLQMWVEAVDQCEDDPLADLRERKHNLRQIADSEPPKAPVAETLLSAINGEGSSADLLADVDAEG